MFAKREKKYKTKYNLAGTLGWFGNIRYNIERYTYLLHRITGIGLVAFLLLHIYITGFRMYGESVYESIHGLLNNPYADAGMVIVLAAILFHGVNGLRLILNEYGFLLGRPKRPIYPYRKVLKTSKPRGLLIGMLIIGILLFLIVVYEFLLVWVF